MAGFPQGRVTCPYNTPTKVLDIPYRGAEGTRILLQAGSSSVVIGDSTVNMTDGWIVNTTAREFVFTAPDGDVVELWAIGANPDASVTLKYFVCNAT
jgi:hypothetical protein